MQPQDSWDEALAEGYVAYVDKKSRLRITASGMTTIYDEDNIGQPLWLRADIDMAVEPPVNQNMDSLDPHETEPYEVPEALIKLELMQLARALYSALDTAKAMREEHIFGPTGRPELEPDIPPEYPEEEIPL